MNYDAITGDYDTDMRHYFSGPLLEFEAMTLPKLDSQFSGRLLDIGCSTGIQMELLCSKLPRAQSFTGLDSSEQSIAVAAKTNNDRRCSYDFADMHNLPYSDASFDFVYSRYTVHYSADLPAVMREIHRVLVAGGKTYIKVCHPLYELFAKQSKDYASSEVTDFPVQSGDIAVAHGTHTLGDYLNAVVESGLILDSIDERYSGRSNVAGFHIPTQLLIFAHKMGVT